MMMQLSAWVQKKEKVNYPREIKIAEDPRINVWLSKVDIEMMNSLALELDKSVNGINTNPENRMKIIEIHPA